MLWVWCADEPCRLPLVMHLICLRGFCELFSVYPYTRFRLRCPLLSKGPEPRCGNFSDLEQESGICIVTR